MIHKACVLLGCRSAASAGKARCSNVMSRPRSIVGNASKARPNHSRAPADDRVAADGMMSVLAGKAAVLQRTVMLFSLSKTTFWMKIKPLQYKRLFYYQG